MPELGANIQVKRDWTGTYTTAIKNQGSCGSCWAFSAVEQTESDAIRTLGISTPLSTQQVISCDLVDGGCNGGNTGSAYGYMKRSKGVVSAKDYPDRSHATGGTGSCAPLKLSHPVVKVEALGPIVQKLINALLGKGIPISPKGGLLSNGTVFTEDGFITLAADFAKLL